MTGALLFCFVGNAVSQEEFFAIMKSSGSSRPVIPSTPTHNAASRVRSQNTAGSASPLASRLPAPVTLSALQYLFAQGRWMIKKKKNEKEAWVRCLGAFTSSFPVYIAVLGACTYINI